MSHNDALDVLQVHEGEVRVLIVEDDPVSALLLKKFFDTLNIPVHCASSGDEALKMREKHEYRLVLSDWMMPGMSGVDLCRKIRQMPGPYTYFFLCTAKGDRADRYQAFDAGVDDFLQKPVDQEELGARIKVARRILMAEDDLQQQKLHLEEAGERLKTMNNNLMVASKRFEGLFHGLPMACFTFDSEGVIHEWNKAAENLFNKPGYEVFQTHIWDTLKGCDKGFWSRKLIKSVFRGKESMGIEWTFAPESDNRRFLVCNIFQLRSASGEIIGAISANLDITDRKLAEQKVEEYAQELAQKQEQLVEANKRLEHLAVTDGLTGLLNKRRLMEDLDRFFAEHERAGQPLSIVMLDIDHFKSYNDTYGHQAGDILLKEFADLLTRQARKHECIARYGGEEFAVILLNADEKKAVVAAERFRKAVLSTNWPKRRVTVSFGVATKAEGMTSASEIIQRADEALYKSKRDGRNRVTEYSQVVTEKKKSGRKAA